MISEEQAEEAVEFLRRNAKAAAQAKAERIYMEEFRKTVKSTLMNDLIGESIGAQERYAYSHAKYAAHLDAMRTAVENDEEKRWLMVAAQARIEAWRSMNANARAEGRAYS